MDYTERENVHNLFVFSILKNELFKVQLIFKQRALRYDPVDNRLSL